MKLKKTPRKLVNLILNIFSGAAFCCLFNLRSKLKNRDIRCAYDKDERLYYVAEADKKVRSYNKKFINTYYQDGFERRARHLAGQYLIDQIDFEDGDLVIDCGANIGDLKMFFHFTGTDIEYLPLEPSPQDFECLSYNCDVGKESNAGLWHSKDTLSFYLSTATRDSSLIKPPTYDEVIDVEVERLDKRVPGRKIKLLKLEAEGAEPEICKGCEEILGNIDYIAADLGFERGVAQETTLVPVVNYLTQRGFELVDINYERLVVLFKNRSAAQG